MKSFSRTRTPFGGSQPPCIETPRLSCPKPSPFPEQCPMLQTFLLPFSIQHISPPHPEIDNEDPTPSWLHPFWESSLGLVSFYFPSGSAPEATPLKERKRLNFEEITPLEARPGLASGIHFPAKHFRIMFLVVISTSDNSLFLPEPRRLKKPKTTFLKVFPSQPTENQYKRRALP